MTKKPLNEEPGLLGHAYDRWRESGKKRRNARAAAYAASPEGQKEQGAKAFNAWRTKIAADWEGYSHVHDLQPTLANLTQFFNDQYHINAAQFLATPTAAPAQASANKNGGPEALGPSATPTGPGNGPKGPNGGSPSPSAPSGASGGPTGPAPSGNASQAAPAPEASSEAPAQTATPAPAPAQTAPAPTSTSSQPASPSPQAPEAPEAPEAAEAPEAPETVAPTAEEPQQYTLPQIKSLQAKEEEILKTAKSKDDRRAARKRLRKLIDLEHFGPNKGVSEDIIAPGIREIDDLPTTVGDRTFKDKSLIDTMKELGLYDPDSKKAKPSETLTEDEANLNLDEVFTKAARFILRDKNVLAASKKYTVGSNDYNRYLSFLRKKDAESGNGRAQSTSQSASSATPLSSFMNTEDMSTTPQGYKLASIIKRWNSRETFDRLSQAMSEANGDPREALKTLSDADAKRLLAALMVWATGGK